MRVGPGSCTVDGSAPRTLQRHPHPHPKETPDGAVQENILRRGHVPCLCRD